MDCKYKKNGSSTLGALVYLLFLCFIISAYVVNIVKFTNLDFEKPYKAEVIRGVGIVTGIVGIVVGYMDIEDKKE